jgi:predicted RNA-binding protein with PUA-like domain
MAYWLLKTEPEQYSFGDLVRDGTTAWTGVANAQAQANLRSMRIGDQAFVYHSGERRVAGLAEVVRAAYPDPTASREGLVCVDIRALGPLPAPVPLEALKLEPALAGSALLRQGRLSVVPLTPSEWRDIADVAEVIARTGGMPTGARF